MLFHFLILFIFIFTSFVVSVVFLPASFIDWRIYFSRFLSKIRKKKITSSLNVFCRFIVVYFQFFEPFVRWIDLYSQRITLKGHIRSAFWNFSEKKKFCSTFASYLPVTLKNEGYQVRIQNRHVGYTYTTQKASGSIRRGNEQPFYGALMVSMTHFVYIYMVKPLKA